MQLRGFARVRQLPAGTQQRVHMTLDARDLSVFDTTSMQWRVVHGLFTLAVGHSSSVSDFQVQTTFKN